MAVDALRLTALILVLTLSVPAAALILRGMATAPAATAESGRRRLLEGTFALAPVVLLVVLIALSALRA